MGGLALSSTGFVGHEFARHGDGHAITAIYTDISGPLVKSAGQTPPKLGESRIRCPVRVSK
jgi:hypothetical protein